ncbi:MAG TPA: hypothetical protein VGN14_00590, partial [Candidatus Elarobacter sp.]
MRFPSAKRDIVGTLQSLRTKLQAQVSGPAVVVVTSATSADGAPEIAFGLAHSYAASGRSTAFVDLWGHSDVPRRYDRVASFRLRALPSLEFSTADVGGNLHLLSAASNAGCDIASAAAWGEALEELRRAFDVTVFDAAAVAERGTGVQLLGRADAVLIAASLGRSVLQADRDLVDLLAGTRARVAGTVTHDKNALRTLRRLRAPAHHAELG